MFRCAAGFATRKIANLEGSIATASKWHDRQSWTKYFRNMVQPSRHWNDLIDSLPFYTMKNEHRMMSQSTGRCGRVEVRLHTLLILCHHSPQEAQVVVAC